MQKHDDSDALQVVVEWKAEFPNAASRRASVPLAQLKDLPKKPKTPKFPVKELTDWYGDYY